MAKTPAEEFASASSMEVASPHPPYGPGGGGFFGHPKGLGTLFFTEMWERFSYYGMRALLVLFMTAPIAAGGLGFNVAKAGAIYGLYTSFVYLLALPGGWVADRIIGQRKAVLYGGIIIAAGHFSMAIESMASFYAGLMLIVVGTGLLKPNVSTMVGELYPGTGAEASARRDAGFSIFYMGINLGAFIAPLVTGFLGEKIDWHLGFAAAGVGMVIGLIQYVIGGKHLGEAGLYPDDAEPEAVSRQKRYLYVFGTAAVTLVILLLFVLKVSVEAIAGAGTFLIVGTALLYFLYIFLAGGLTREEKKKVGVVGVFFVAAAVFWAGFEQHGSSFNLVGEQLTNRVIGGWEAPASWLQSANPLFIILFAGVFAWLWVYLARKGKEPSSPAKFALGLMLLGAGFVVMIFAMTRSAQGELISPMWLLAAFYLHTMGELTLSPVGLSTVTKLAPRRMVGQMMGIWFMATSLGNLIAGQVAGMIGAGELDTAGQISPAAATEVFTTVAAVGIGAGVLLLLLTPLIKRGMGGVQ
jgi:POT family proton-dependent oligopeptide transporter